MTSDTPSGRAAGLPHGEDAMGERPTSSDDRGAAIPGRVLAATFLVALAGVCLEVALVRVFALLFRYHHLFLLVSVAVCGLGLGGLIRTYLPDRWIRLWAVALLFGLSIPATLLLLFRSPLATRLVETPWLPAVPLVPFLFAGLFLAEVFRRHAAQGGALYFADLSGAALAALLILPLLQWLGGIGVCLLLGVLLCIGATLLAAGESSRGRIVGALAAMACLLLLVTNPRTRLVDLPLLPAGADPSRTKPLLREMRANPSIRILETRWSAFARTDMTEEGDPSVRYLYTDGDTPTNMIRFDGDLKKVEGLKRQIAFLPYTVSSPESVLCIGPGGGMDVLLGLLGGAKRITGAEVSADIVRLMEAHRDFNGRLYEHPGVSIHVADGRSFVARSREKHDLIFSALTQSATGSRAGIALAESYIHTREAFQVYLDHLTDEGIYALVVQEEPVLVRAFLTAVSVLAERGASVPEACRHLVAAMIPREMHPFTPYRRILLVRRSPFTPADSERVLDGIRALGVHSLFVPHVLEELPPFADLASGKQSLEEYIAEYQFEGTHLNVAPRPDDQPFFLDLSPTMPPVLLRLLWGIGLVTLLAGAWLAFRHRRGGPGAPLRSLLGTLYFALLGAGFMLLEVPFIQQFILFLGHPVLSLTLVLFALLLGTAAGSRRSQRWAVSALPARVFAAATGIVILVLLYRAVLPGVFALLLGQPVVVRGAATVALLLPLGMLLGMPFPSGIRWFERDGSDQVPWLWGINGFASVLGSVLAMVLAWKSGFSAALLAGMGSYVLVAILAGMAHLTRKA